MTNRAGFTLIELVIVLIIGALLLMMVMPHIDVAEMRVRSAEQQVSTTVLAAQQRAVMKQHDMRIVFDTAGHRLLVHDDENNDGVQDQGELIRVVELAEGVRFTGAGTPGTPPEAVTFRAGAEGMPVLTFHRGGFGSEAGMVHLGTARSERGDRVEDARRLVVERATGRVTRHHVTGGIWQSHRS